MTLLLRIENFDQLENGGPTSLQLDGRSASVGRRASMDWSLPDPSKMISGHHFDITFEDGEYYLTDVSMNGTFVDGQRHRLEGRLHLRGGERLIVGHYIVGVTLQRAGAASQPPVAQDDPWGAFDPTGMQPVSGGRGGAGLDALNDGFVQVQRPAGGMKTETSLQLPMAGAGSGTGGIQTPTGWGQPLPPQPQPQVPGPSEEPFVAYVPTLGQEPDETPPATPLPEASRPAPQPRPSAPPSAEVPYTPTLGQDEAEAPVSYAPDPVAPEAVPAPLFGPPAGADSGVGTGVVPGMGHDPGAMPGTGGSGPDPQGFAPAFGAPENPEGRAAPPPAPQPNAIPMPRPVPPGPPQYQPQAPVGAPADGPRGGDVGPALRAFCEGAGLDPKSVKPEQAVQLMHMLGRCVRVATEESMHMLKARADVKNFTRGGVRTMLSANANNPMKFMPDSQQALELMFVSPRDGFMTGSEAFKDALGDIRQHQEAVFRALQPALAEVFRGLSPEEIEAACESTGSNLLGKRSGKQWPTYVERWDQKAQAGEHGILDAFLQAFARAYAEANKS